MKMMLLILIIIGLLVIPSVKAVWYNPFTWFSTEENPTTTSSQLIADEETRALYEDFTNEVQFYFQNDLLNVDYKDISIKLDVGIVTNSNVSKNWTELKTLFPNAKQHIHIYDKIHEYKYAINITNIPL